MPTPDPRQTKNVSLVVETTAADYFRRFLPNFTPNLPPIKPQHQSLITS